MAFGPQHITTQTPTWAKWMFRITLLLTTAAVFVISGDPALSDGFKIRMGVYLKGVDIVIYGLSKMFGVEVEKETRNQRNRVNSFTR